MRSGSHVALLLGGGVTALGGARALALAGIPSIVPADDRSGVNWSRCCSRAPPLRDQALDAYIKSLPQTPVVIACSDKWVREVNSVRGILTAGVAVAGPTAIAEVFLDKGRFAEFVARKRVPHPRTVRVQVGQSSEGRYFDGVFIKPRDSQAFLRRFGVKALFPDSAQDLAAKLEMVMNAGLEVVLQEYLPGPASNHYFIDGYVDRSGKIRAMLVRRRLRMYPPRFGNSSHMISVDSRDADPAIEGVRRLLEGSGFRGVFSAEFKRDPRDDVFKILEVNIRPWWFVEFTARCGVNVMAMSYRDALGLPVGDAFRYDVGRRMTHPYYDVQACWRAWKQGDLGALEWLRTWIRSESPTLRWNDPLPAVRSSLQFARRFVSRRMGAQ